jgi:taurine dioxygenase
MAYETIRVTPVTPRIGADVDGIALSKPLSNREIEDLHQALVEHQVLFFRNQPLDVESHKALGRCFGELHIHPNTPGPEGHPEVLPIHADANSKRVAGEVWHSDVSCDEHPPMASVLYLHTVPPTGGDTLFASQFAAYDAFFAFEDVSGRVNGHAFGRALLSLCQFARRPRRCR